MINDIETWLKYQEIYKAHQNGELKRDDPSIPDHVRELYEGKMLTPADLSYELLKKMFLQICNSIYESYKVDKLNEPVIDLLIMYLRKDEKFLSIDPSYKFSRGLLMRGSIGSGKTIIIKAFNKLVNSLRFFAFINDHTYYSAPDTFKIVTSNKLAEMYSLDGFEIFAGNINGRKSMDIDLVNQMLFIDDIGSEPVTSHFGSALKIIPEILIRRYEHGSITHATSNLGTDDLKELYGLRIYDRMREMFNDIILPGESRRK